MKQSVLVYFQRIAQRCVPEDRTLHSLHCENPKSYIVQYNLGKPTYVGPRYRQITENDGLLEKVGTNLLSCTAQHRSSRIDYHLTEFIIITAPCGFKMWHLLSTRRTILCCYDLIQKHTFKNTNLISWKNMYVFVGLIETVYAESHTLVPELMKFWLECEVTVTLIQKFFP
jgi:hypothetical protein